MAQMTPQVSELLEKALELSEQEWELLVDRLVGSLANEPAEQSVEGAWSEEIKRRVDDIRSGRVKTIPRELVLRELPKSSRMASKSFQFHPEAREEFRSAIRWYRSQNPLVSPEFRIAVSSGIRQIAEAPQR
jgi:putative addiction module component (TIGR02574 family)